MKLSSDAYLFDAQWALGNNSAPLHAPVAKLDKAPVYETGDCWFESNRVRHLLIPKVAAQIAAEVADLSGVS